MNCQNLTPIQDNNSQQARNIRELSQPNKRYLLKKYTTRILINGGNQSTFFIGNNVMLALDTSIQHFNGSPSQCNNKNERFKENLWTRQLFL